MADFEVFGVLSGTFLREAYSFTADGRTVTVAKRASESEGEVWGVAVRWPSAPSDDDEAVRDLKSWLEDYLRASSVAVGSSVFVLWDGVHRYDRGGGHKVGRFFTVAWALARRDREQFDSYQPLVNGIRLHPEAATAASHLQNALSLVHQSQEASASEAYRAIEALVRPRPKAGDWEAFGQDLAAAGKSVNGADLIHLWASFQFYRHDPSATGSATRRLSRIGRQPLTYGECCWRAAEILELYVDAKLEGKI